MSTALLYWAVLFVGIVAVLALGRLWARVLDVTFESAWRAGAATVRYVGTIVRRLTQ